jgi:hypothetical protein
MKLPNAEYKAAERARRKAEGYVRLELWVRPAWIEAIKALVRGLEGEK